MFRVHVLFTLLMLGFVSLNHSKHISDIENCKGVFTSEEDAIEIFEDLRRCEQDSETDPSLSLTFQLHMLKYFSLFDTANGHKGLRFITDLSHLQTNALKKIYGEEETLNRLKSLDERCDSTLIPLRNIPDSAAVPDELSLSLLDCVTDVLKC